MMPWVFLRIERWIGKIIQVLTWDLLQKMVNQDLGNGVHLLELYVYIYICLLHFITCFKRLDPQISVFLSRGSPVFSPVDFG